MARLSPLPINGLSCARGLGTLLDVVAVRIVGSLVASALLLVAPGARAECAKATTSKACRRTEKFRKPLPPKSHRLSTHREARSPWLVVGGIGVVLVGVASFAFAAYTRTPCQEHTTEPCSDALPYFYGSLATGIGGVLGGSGMIYFGALDSPAQRPSSLTLTPWTPRLVRGVSLGFRF